VYLGDNTTHQIFVHGNISIKFKNDQIRDIPNVLHVPSFFLNLFFTKQLDLVGGEIVIKKGQCTFKNNKGQTIAICNIKFDCINYERL
jgi:hypothetical protein